MTDLSRASAPDDDGIPRRTLIAGAAWSIPVIAIATATPAQAVSNALSLAFSKNAYTGVTCSYIGGASVLATVNGTAAAGKPVTVTLGNGYRFSDGSVTNTQLSGTDGRVALPSINVPLYGGTGTFSAVSGASVANATASASPSSARAYTYAGAGTST
ncbi:hypothetical protein AVW09_16880, partial [Microbacterium sp. T32]